MTGYDMFILWSTHPQWLSSTHVVNFEGLIWLQPGSPAPGMTVGIFWHGSMGTAKRIYRKLLLHLFCNAAGVASMMIDRTGSAAGETRVQWYPACQLTKWKLSNTAAHHPHKTGHPAGKSSRTEDVQGTWVQSLTSRLLTGKFATKCSTPTTNLWLSRHSCIFNWNPPQKKNLTSHISRDPLPPGHRSHTLQRLSPLASQGVEIGARSCCRKRRAFKSRSDPVTFWKNSWNLLSLFSWSSLQPELKQFCVKLLMCRIENRHIT